MKIFHRLANLNWAAVVLPPLIVIAMEVCWFYPWLIWIGNWQTLVEQRPPLSLTSVILLIGVSFLATRFLLGREWPGSRIQWAIVGCGLIAVFIAVRVEYGTGFGLLDGQWFVHTTWNLFDSFLHPHPVAIAPVAGVFLWWRGIKWGRSTIYTRGIYSSFLVGLAAFVLLILVWRATAGDAPSASLMATAGFYLAGFFFFGLAALALGNLRAVRRRMLAREEVSQVFSRRLLTVLFGVVGGIILVGVGISSIISLDFIAFVGRVLSTVAGFLLQILNYLLIPISFLAAGLFYIVQFLLNLIRQGQTPQPLGRPVQPAFEELQERFNPQGFPPEAILALKWGFFALVIIAVIFLLARAILRYRSSPTREGIEEVHESLWSWGGFKADLYLFFSIIWHRWRRKRERPVPESPVLGWYQEEEVQGMLGIREIYRHLLWATSRSRVARWRHETPYEYARRLGQAIPDGSEPLGDLTNLYVNVRYGDLEAEDKQVEQANNSWRFFNRLLQRFAGG